jgi:hypothetical protein
MQLTEALVFFLLVVAIDKTRVQVQSAQKKMFCARNREQIVLSKLRFSS